MTQQQYIIQRKLNMLELGKTLGNISQACRKLGVSRQHYYDIKQAIEEEGLEGLLEKTRRVPRHGNRVLPEVEEKVLDYALQFPVHGPLRRPPLKATTPDEPNHRLAGYRLATRIHRSIPPILPAKSHYEAPGFF